MNQGMKQLKHIFQTNLSDRFSGEDYWLQVSGVKYALVEHSDQSRLEVRKRLPELMNVPDEELTHYTMEPVPIPLGTVIRISIRHSNKTGKIPGEYGIHHVAIHIVADDQVHQSMATDGQEKMVSQRIDYVSTAKSLLFHHPDLITQDPKVAPIVDEHMDQVKAPDTFLMIEKLAGQMRLAGPPSATTGWAHYQKYDAGAKGVKQTVVPTTETINNAGPAMTAVQVSTKNDLRLQNKKWTQEEGHSVGFSGTSTLQSSDPEMLANVNTNVDSGVWAVSLSNTNKVHGLQTSVQVTDGNTQTVKISMKNTFVRWLGVYIEFVDSNGKVMNVPAWQPNDNGIIQDIMSLLKLEYDNMRFIGWIAPVDTVFSIPIFADPGTFDVSITFPKGAVSANIYGCGLGTGNNPYPKTPIVGGVFTGMANLAIPAFFLGLQVAAQSYKPLYDIMNNPKLIKGVIGAGVIYFGQDFIIKGAVDKKMDWHAFSSLSQIIFTSAASKALVWCEEQTIAGKIEEEIPFAGWIMLALNIATTVAQLAETIVEVATSPWMIENKLAITVTSALTVHPDPRHIAFPMPPAGVQASYMAKMIYKQENRPSISTSSVPLDSAKYPATLVPSFSNTLGGQVKFEVDFYFGNWLAGKATTSWMDNNTNTEAITLYLFQNPIPLDAQSIYKHTSILGYQNSAYTWMAQGVPPTATINSASTSQSGNAISLWSGLTLSQKSGMVGSSWKAAGMGITDCSTGAGGQLYGFQNIDIPGTTMADEQFPSCGFSGPSQLVYDVFPPKFEMANGKFVLKNNLPVPDPKSGTLGDYYIDPRKSNSPMEVDGGYHLRQVVLGNSDATSPVATPPFEMSVTQNSFGRFPYSPDAITMHPSGHAIAVNSKHCKLMITPLQASGVADFDVPLACNFAGKAVNFQSSNGRAGLLFTPISLTCSTDGTILVLEQIINSTFNLARIQAFDLNGNPVNCFGNASPFLQLPNDVTYLDVIAIGGSHSTFIYVLYYSGSGSAASDYSMSIYQYGTGAPAGNLLVTTPNMPAAKISVDMWHTLYTLNYAMTEDGNGNAVGPQGGPEVGPKGRTVPSVSEWLPPSP